MALIKSAQSLAETVVQGFLSLSPNKSTEKDESKTGSLLLCSLNNTLHQ